MDVCPTISVKGRAYYLPCVACGCLHKNRRWIWLQQVPHGTPGCVPQEGNADMPFEVTGLCYQAGANGGTEPRPFNQQLQWGKGSNTYNSPTLLLICHKAYLQLPAYPPTPQAASPAAVSDVAINPRAQDQDIKDLRQEVRTEVEAKLCERFVEHHPQLENVALADMPRRLKQAAARREQQVRMYSGDLGWGFVALSGTGGKGCEAKVPTVTGFEKG